MTQVRYFGAAASGRSRHNHPSSTLLTPGLPHNGWLLMLVLVVLLSAAPAFSATFIVNSTADPGDGTCDVANCTFREAINAANSAGGLDVITFNILPSGPKTIVLNGGLQIQNSPAIVDATTQPGWAGIPIIELNGNGSGGDGIAVFAGSSTVRGFIINRFTGNGIAMQNVGGNTITGNYIGTNAAGSAALGNGQHGILISGSPGNAVGGTTAVDRNIISGNANQGIRMQNGNTENNLIKGNYIGVDVTGTIDLGNGAQGVVIDSAPFGEIGGGEPGAGNIISGNGSNGIVIFNSSATGNRIQGNLIGTDVTGTIAIPNEIGILLGDATLVRGSSNDFIGTDGDGVEDATEGNLVSGNNLSGIVLAAGGTSQNRVAGNRIGVNAAGTAALPNGENGILLREGPTNNLIGTNGDGISDAEERNIVSGNLLGGIAITGGGTNQNRISGNFIGTNAAGTAAVPNGQNGVLVPAGITGTFIGTNGDGTGDAVEGNLISGNAQNGVLITGSGTSNNRIAGNRIGTTAAGTGAVPNFSSGVRIETNANNNFVGTNLDGISDTLEGNTISGNQGSGVAVTDVNTNANRILGNSIFLNGGLGIDLLDDGVTANDAGDGDPGPNQLQNYPVLTSATSGSTNVNFTFNSTANEQFRIEFFRSLAADPSGFGEGQAFLGFMNITTDGGGNFTGVFTVPLTTPGGQFISATATRLSTGSTSEFSDAEVVIGPTAAEVVVAGRVLTSDGRPISLARVSITSEQGLTRSALTNAFGFYRFDDIAAGETYILQAGHKRYSFAPRLVNVTDDVLDADIVADPPGKAASRLNSHRYVGLR